MINLRIGAAGIALFSSLAFSAVAVHAAHAAPQRATHFVAALSGAGEVPAVTSEGKGTLRATLNSKHTALNWKVTFSGLSGPVTAAHFHGPAAAGENTGVAIPLSGAMKSPITGNAKLTPAQAADLLAGKWYLNLHTAANPNGEIRGQVMMKQ